MPEYQIHFAQAQRSKVYHLVAEVWKETTFCSRGHQNWSIHNGHPPEDRRLCRQCHRVLKNERVFWQRLDLEHPEE